MINHQLKTWVNFSTLEARSIVRKILASAPHRELGLRTHEIYERAHEEFPDVTTDIPPGKPVPTGNRHHGGRPKPAQAIPLPPKLDHAIRSVKYLKKTILEEMAMAQEVEKVHIKRGKLHEDGTRDISIVSKAYGKTEITSDLNMSMSSFWHWRLTPDHKTKINNYPKPPIEKILWKPGEKEARKRARETVGSVAPRQRTERYEKPIEGTEKLNVREGIKADDDVAKRTKTPEFPAFSR